MEDGFPRYLPPSADLSSTGKKHRPAVRIRRVLWNKLLPVLLFATPVDAARVLFIAGPKSHPPGQHEHPAGCKLLAENLMSAVPGLDATVSTGWPADPALVSSSDTLVIYGDGVAQHPAIGHMEALRARAAAGKGLAVLHFSLEPANAEMAALLDDTIGGHFDPAWSVNPVWKLESPVIAKHPATSGVVPWTMEEEMYFHIRLRDDVTPLLRAHPPLASLGNDGPRSGNPAVRKALAQQQIQTLAWVVENKNGSRGFGFTPGHTHHLWNQPPLRTLVMNAILWTAKLPVPENGVPSSVSQTTTWPDIDTAIAKGDLADVKTHLRLHPESARKGGKPTSRPPLEQAILRNKTEIALYLISAGADPNTVNSSQRTPLHLCIDRNNPKIIAALLKAGAKPDLLDKDGWTPLHHAAAKNQLDSAKALIGGGANPSMLSKLGGTPLHEAAASGGAELIKLLLDHKVDPAIRSKEGVTALDLAKKYANKPAIQALGGE